MPEAIAPHLHDVMTTYRPSCVPPSQSIYRSQFEFSTLTVQVPSSPDANETLTVITEYYDADDVPLLPLVGDDEPSWAGGLKGVALFLPLLVLAVGTACCGGLILLIAG